MQYTTKVDKTSETLSEIAHMISQLEEERVLAAILNKRLSHDDIVGYTWHLREKRARQQAEIESLRRFSRTFNKEYATDHNKCFSTAVRLFGIIRSNMSETMKLFKRFCPTVMSRGPIEDGMEQKPNVMDHSMLSPAVPYTPYMFGIESCDPCVKEFLEILGLFFMDVQDAITMCEDVLNEESIIRKDTARCYRLYESCCQEVLERSYEFVEYFGKEAFAREDSMSAEMHDLPSIQDFASGHFHMHNKNEFQIHVWHKTFHEGKANDLNDSEMYLWPTDHQMALKARAVLQHFDELNPRGRRVGCTERYRLSGKHVAVFMKWCGIKDNKKEKHFVENYFNNYYTGIYEKVAYSTVNTAKNKLLRDEIGEAEIKGCIDQLLNKYSA